jgi:translation initiation factor 2 subunit 3
LRTRIVSLFAEGNDLQFAVPGGLIGVGTLVDPILCKGDKLLGNVMTAVGKGADIYVELEISCKWTVSWQSLVKWHMLSRQGNSLLAATIVGSKDHGQEAGKGKSIPADHFIRLEYWTYHHLVALTQVQKLTAGEQLFVNVGASQVGGRVLGVKGDLAKIALTAPACAQAKDKVALSRRIDKHWRLVGKYKHQDAEVQED